MKGKNIALLFPGQGSQYVGMGMDIYNKYPIARQVIRDCDLVISKNLKSIMFTGPMHQLTKTSLAQPAILAHSMALLQVLHMHYGFDVKDCRLCLGHSLGEYSALVATQSIDLAQAIRLVHLRGKAMELCISSPKKTSMKAIILLKDHLEDVEKMWGKIQSNLPVGEIVQIANVNSSSQIVLSGTSKGVDYAASILHSKGYSGRALPLPVSAPFHCSLMSPALDAMKPALEHASFKTPIIPVLSNVTCLPYASAKSIGSLLTRQITHTVQWYRCIQYAKENGVNNWLVVGPSKVLGNLLKKEFPKDSILSISNLQDMEEFKDWIAK